MPYQVISDGAVSVLKKVGEFKTGDGDYLGDEHESVIRIPEEIIPDAEVAPVVVRAYDEGNERVRSLLLRVDKKSEAAVPKPEVKKVETEAKPALPPSQNVNPEGAIRSGSGKSQIAGAKPSVKQA